MTEQSSTMPIKYVKLRIFFKAVASRVEKI